MSDREMTVGLKYEVPRDTAVPRKEGEVSNFLDRLHGEIMKNRQLYGMLDSRLGAILNSPEPMPESPDEPFVTELGSRLCEMLNHLTDTNKYLSSLHNRIQL